MTQTNTAQAAAILPRQMNMTAPQTPSPGLSVVADRS